MEKFKKLIALACASAVFTGQIQAQDYCSQDPVECNACAYEDSTRSSYLSAALPIGALVVAAIIIATSNRGGHHSSSGGCCNNRTTTTTTTTGHYTHAPI